jgi:hypothetical protein
VIFTQGHSIRDGSDWCQFCSSGPY